MVARPHVGPWGDFNLSPDPGAHSMMDVGHGTGPGPGMTASISEGLKSALTQQVFLGGETVTSPKEIPRNPEFQGASELPVLWFF